MSPSPQKKKKKKETKKREKNNSLLCKEHYAQKCNSTAIVDRLSICSSRFFSFVLAVHFECPCPSCKVTMSPSPQNKKEPKKREKNNSLLCQEH